MKKGFTLLELLVTISIIGILLAIGSASFSTAQRRGRDSRRQADMKSVQKALEQYYAVETEYPDSVSSGGSITTSGGEVTMNQVPYDPKNSGSYVYSYSKSATNDAYCLCAYLENLETGNADNAGANGVCSWDADETNNDYFCVANQ